MESRVSLARSASDKTDSRKTLELWSDDFIRHDNKLTITSRIKTCRTSVKNGAKIPKYV